MPDSHIIYDAEADIRELDVGDLDDMESDVRPMFVDKLKQRRQRPPSLSDMSNPADWALSSQSGMQMSFATLTMEKAEELGKKGSDTLGAQWTSLLQTGGVKATVYVTDPGRFLLVTNAVGALAEVKKFVLSQPDVDYWEYNQARSYPEGRSAPFMDDDARRDREVQLGWRTPPKPKAKLPSKDKAKIADKKAAKKELEVRPDGDVVQSTEVDPKSQKKGKGSKRVQKAG